jgi:hypothetical protein
VLGVRDDDEDQPPVLVVEDLSERGQISEERASSSAPPFGLLPGALALLARHWIARLRAPGAGAGR